MGKSLIIVESPTKAKTISKFVDTKKYQVESSFGHIRDLPVSKMGIDVEKNFEPQYVIPKDKSKTVTALKKSLAKADTIILAPDEDREGEAIAWHLLQALKVDPKKTDIKRIVFHEITKEAILHALEHPREINTQLVDAQQARRVLDRLVGYELSPFLWKKVAKGLSAGRVQSAAVRLIVEREEEIRAFEKQEYWSIKVLLDTNDAAAQTITIKKVEEENSDDDSNSAEIAALEPQTESQLIASLHAHKGDSYDRLAIADEKQVQSIIDDLKNHDFSISGVDKKEQRRSPQPPFTTSTLQQTANRRLGFSAKQTMYIAQQLYEGIELGNKESQGLITYMRTDSVNLSEKFLGESRTYIEKQHGKEFVPAQAITYKTKSKGAQEAHEAIRPTQAALSPDQVKPYLDDKQFKLYQLIWQRAMASQMTQAVFDATTIDITAGDYTLRASGQIIKFPGFMAIYPTDSKETVLPEVTQNQKLFMEELRATQHFTKPPARYSDATIVKKLEELGIGRPSTYAPIISTIQARNYVEKDGRHLKPTEIGEIVNKILVKHFPDIVDFNFTATMEDSLDHIATGDKEWIPVIKDFYQPFKSHLDKKQDEVSKKDLEEETDEKCDQCGKHMVIKVGRYGKFLACSGYPECRNAKPIAADGETSAEPESLGKDPESGLSVYKLTGRFGPYVQLGEKTEENKKPKRASLKPAKDPNNVSLEEALKLLSLPRTLGEHPEKKEPIIANNGRFGPYVGCDGEYRSIKEPDTVFEITLERALELLAQPKASRGGRKALKEFGQHKKKKLTLQTGKYGPYLKWGAKNISLPDDLKEKETAELEKLTLEDAVKIIEGS